MLTLQCIFNLSEGEIRKPQFLKSFKFLLCECVKSACYYLLKWPMSSSNASGKRLTNQFMSMIFFKKMILWQKVWFAFKPILTCITYSKSVCKWGS